MLIGGGGHCKSVIDSVRSMNKYEDIVITDPVLAPGTDVLGCKVVGTDACLQQLKKDGFDSAFITIGSVRVGHIRDKLSEEIKNIGFSFPVIIDSSANVANTATIGEGTFIGKNVVINIGAKIGRHCIINTGAIIEHDCVVNDYTHISVGTILCGEVHVGSNCMIGAHSTNIQCLSIGDNCMVGAGATVINNSSGNCMLVGTPAMEKGRVIE